MNKRIALLCLPLLCLAAAARAAEPAGILWLSDVAPRSARKAPPAGQDKPAKPTQDNMDAVIGGAEGESVSGGNKRLWLRQGDDLAQAAYLESAAYPAAFDLLDVHGRRRQVAQTPTGGLAQGRFELAEMGFYNAYAMRAAVRDGVLQVQLAKAELLRGTCCRQDIDPIHDRAIGDPLLPLEIVREHEPDEKLFTRMVSGDTIHFVVQRLGKPLAGARVTMLTQQGWRKTALSDAEGRVAFTLIRDYFPAWHDFKRRNRETFVVLAEAAANTAGTHAGSPYARVAYQATLSGRYQPSPYDYKSYAWGLGIAVFVCAFGGLGIYLYRRRRVKPFKEVRFSESA
jgi:hypothetical protein